MYKTWAFWEWVGKHHLHPSPGSPLTLTTKVMMSRDDYVNSDVDGKNNIKIKWLSIIFIWTTFPFHWIKIILFPLSEVKLCTATPFLNMTLIHFRGDVLVIKIRKSTRDGFFATFFESRGLNTRRLEVSLVSHGTLIGLWKSN